jgi:BirA family biotin operon repressor/biotin-[acetyl-CoA-carboxylase] ligase
LGASHVEDPADRLDASRVATASGWRVIHRAETTSTNDDASAARAQGAGSRTVVVADLQTAGRGREGRWFASPPGGLYLSMLVRADPDDLPAPLVAAVALAAAEALEAVGVPHVAIKWPNDLWVGGRKVGGILLEGPGSPGAPVIAGLGVNLRQVPTDLPPPVRATLTALDHEVGRRVAREALLVALLGRVDARLVDLAAPASRALLAEAYARRQALLGAAIVWQEGGACHRGRLLAAGLLGLEVDEPGRGRRRLRAEHVVEVRAAGSGQGVDRR